MHDNFVHWSSYGDEVGVYNVWEQVKFFSTVGCKIKVTDMSSTYTYVHGRLKFVWVNSFLSGT